MDKRHKYGIIIDTETCNTMEDPLCYDISWQVIDTKGRVYAERSFAVKEVFCKMPEMMKTAYYANKIPKYWEQIRKGEKKIAGLWEIKKALHEDVNVYNCQFICAHNARFDNCSLNTTQRYISSSKYRYFLPFGLEWWDTMKMAQDVICSKKSYREFCEKNGYTTENKQLRKTAEILYRFISLNNDFIEEHRALEDVDIERQILAYCQKQHKKMRKKLWND